MPTDAEVMEVGGVEADPMRPHLWTVEDYWSLAEAGVLDDCRVELLEGVIVDMSPHGNKHSQIVEIARDALKAAFGRGFWARMQASYNVPPISVLEPDVAVLRGRRRDLAELPVESFVSAVLAVEVAVATLTRDRNAKAKIYAGAGVPEYWIVNVRDQQVEVHREPCSDPSNPKEFRYATIEIRKPGESISPLAAPNASVAVVDLLQDNEED